MPDCRAKHTKYDPAENEFCCSECGAPAGEFYVGESANDAFDECLRLHDDDGLLCSKCGYGTSGKKFAAALIKKRNLVPCPTCKGAGHVKKSE